LKKGIDIRNPESTKNIGTPIQPELITYPINLAIVPCSGFVYKA
jgi:hypothetical protein